MNSYQIDVFGGGAFYVDILRGVVMIVGDDAFATMIRLTLSLGLLWKLFEVAFQHKWDGTMKWFIMSHVVLGALMAPKTTVVINDRLNPGLRANVVKDVPWGLGFPLAVTTQIDAWGTETTETVFSLPDDLRYSRNGTVIASRLVEQASQYRITDLDFASALEEFTIQCVFYDIHFGHYSLETLKKSTDIWSLFRQRASGSRSFRAFDTIYTCYDGVRELDRRWNGVLSEASLFYGVRAFPNKARFTAKQHLLSLLPTSYGFLADLSKSASNIMRQNMMINALRSAVKTNAANVGATAALQNYADSKAHAQTLSAYDVTGRQAARWVYLLKIVFHLLLAGVFPFALILMLTPMWTTVMKAYYSGLFWFILWGPMYAILNRIMAGEAAEDTLAAAMNASGAGITLMTHAGIWEQNKDIASLAGYLSISVPFLSLMIVRGVGTLSHMAGSVLAPSQRAASDAGAEATTGNMNLGVSSEGVHAFNNFSAHSLAMQPALNTGPMTHTMGSGVKETYLNNGRLALDTSGANSVIPQSDIQLGSRMASSYSQEGARLASKAETDRIQASNTLSSAYGDIGQHIYDRAQNTTDAEGYRQSLTASQAKDVNNILNSAETLARDNNIDLTSSLRLIGSASAGARLGLGGKNHSGPFTDSNGLLNKASANLAGDLSVTGMGEAQAKDIWRQAQHISEQNDVKNSFASLSQGVKDGSFNVTNSEGERINEQITSSLNASKSLTESADLAFSKSEAFNQRASLAEENSAAHNSSVNAAWSDWLIVQTGSLAEAKDIATNPTRREELETYSNAFITDQLANGIHGHHRQLETQHNLPSSNNDAYQGYEQAHNAFLLTNRAKIEHFDQQHADSIDTRKTEANLDQPIQDKHSDAVDQRLEATNKFIGKEKDKLSSQQSEQSKEVKDKIDGGASGAAYDAISSKVSNAIDTLNPFSNNKDKK